MKYFISILFLFNSFGYSDSEKAQCNTGKNSFYLSEVEQEIIYYINLVRLNPAVFETSILSPYLDTHPEYSRKYSKSLIKALKKETRKPLLTPTKDLYDFAKNHAFTTGKKGKVGHKSIRGKNFEKRSKKLLNTYTILGENIHYGANNALEIVIDLLVDDGIKDLGHRENFLFTDFKYCSVSIQPHKKYKYNCVIDFAGEKI